MATLGIRFKSHVWKYVGATLLAIASVGAAASAVWPSNDGYSSNNNESYSPAYSSNSSDRYSDSSSSSSGGILSEQHNYNTDKRVYSDYDSMLSRHFYGGSPATANEVRQWQQGNEKIAFEVD